MIPVRTLERRISEEDGGGERGENSGGSFDLTTKTAETLELVAVSKQSIIKNKIVKVVIEMRN